MMESSTENTAGENSTGQGENAVVASSSLGAILREARERLGLSVADVAGQIKFAPRQIEALEADDFQHLPEMAFVRGFVRSYARILQLEPQSLLALLPQPEFIVPALKSDSVEAPFPSARSAYQQNLILLGAALVLAVLATIFIVWHYTTPQVQIEATQVEKEAETEAPSATGMQSAPVSLVAETGLTLPPASAVLPASPAPVLQAPPAAPVLQPPAMPKVSASQPVPQAPPANPANPAIPPNTTAPTGALRLSFGDESWVEVRDKNGRMLLSQNNPRGSELRLDGQAPLSLVIGRASTVQLYYRGKQVDLKPYISAAGDVARLTLE
jgi:cytoskeleton protein RodZ